MDRVVKSATQRSSWTLLTGRRGADEIIDVWMQQPNQRFMSQPWLESLLRWTDMERTVPPVSVTLGAMDEAGVRVGLLSAWHGPNGVLISNGEVAELVGKHPGRFAGVATVDLTDPVAAVRENRRCVRELGFVGVRVVPWLWNLPPNDRRYYPVYVACVEEDVPFCTQIGHTGPLCPSEPGRPIPYLDEVLLDFPQLVVIGGHVGYPWLAEVLSLARKYPNFYVDTSAYAMHRLPAELVEFMRGRGPQARAVREQLPDGHAGPVPQAARRAGPRCGSARAVPCRQRSPGVRATDVAAA